MFKNRIENIITSKTVTGIEIILLAEGAYEINVVSLKRNKSAVLLEKKISALADFDALSKVVDLKAPIVLVINGKGIIHKKVGVGETDSSSALLNKVLPNANADEFYVQFQEVNASQGYVSVVRASVVNDLIETLKTHAITSLTACFIGPFLINNLLPLIDKNTISNEFLTFNNYKLLIREDRIHDFSLLENALPDAVKVEEELIEGKLLIAFAAALSYFTGGNQGLVNSELLESAKENFRQKQKFQLFGWSLLTVTFIVLIANYFVFDHYWQKSKEMNSTLVLNQSALNRYESLKAEYTQKKKFLSENGLLENSRTSYYADRLAASVPLSIQLLDMDIHPLKKKEAGDLSNAFNFDNKTIRISGKCHRNTALNDWMKEIRKNNWLSEVNLLNYKQDNAKEDGTFYIAIKLK